MEFDNSFKNKIINQFNMYPVLEINYNSHPQLADNVWQAQQAGHPKVLTYCSNTKANRKGAMHYHVSNSRFEIPHIESRDEYPFACTAEGGSSSWVGHIPPKQNSAQGGLIAGFLKRHNIQPNMGVKSKFEVRVINYRNTK